MLIDTNVFIRLLTDPELLGDETLNRLALIDELYASIISPYEIAIKQRIGKLDSFELLVSEANKQSMKLLPLSVEQLRVLTGLVQVEHKDPFDLAIVALAIEKHMPLVTTDRIILSMQLAGLETIDARK